MADFADFDTRGYRTVDARSGYGEWAATYEQTVLDAMDLDLLAELQEVNWPRVNRAVDLGCGTGRTGRWLHDQGIAWIDGVDLSPEMLALAARKGVYHRLQEADVCLTEFHGGEYELVIACLVDEHLRELRPLYAEASRLACPGGFFVLVSFHPQFIMTSGMPTHFKGDSGEPVAIETNVHLLSEQIEAARAGRWTLVEMKERVIDDDWLALKPQWERFRAQPVSSALVWRTEAHRS